MTNLASKMLLIGGLAAAAAPRRPSPRPPTMMSPASCFTTRNEALRPRRRAILVSTIDWSAAEKVCAIEPAGTRLPSEAVVKCRKEAVAGAVEKIHNSRLAALARRPANQAKGA